MPLTFRRAISPQTMKIRSLSLMLIALLVSVITLQAAQPDTAPVRWRTIISTTGPDSGTVTFKALVAPGWHLYGLDLPEGGPKATTFDLSGSTGIKFTGTITPSRPALKIDDPLFGMTLEWWDADVEFKIPFVVTDADAARLNAKIGYMACDGESCRPPKTENVSTPVKLKKQ